MIKLKGLMKETSNVSKKVLVEGHLLSYAHSTIGKVRSGGGNAQNLMDAEIEKLAGVLDNGAQSRAGHSAAEAGWYSNRTLDLFKQLLNSMAADEIKNNNVKDKS